MQDRNQNLQSPSRRRLCLAIGALAFTVGLGLGNRAADAQETYRMKFATQTLNDLQHEYIKVFKREIERATQNRIQVGVFPASQLGGAQRQSEGLRLGSIEAAVGPGELFVGADQRLQGLALGGLFDDLDKSRSQVHLPGLRKAVADVAASKNLLLIGAVMYDLQSFVFKAPVTTLDGFNGKRIRVLASDGEQAMVRALGGSAVPMSLPEVLPALQQGTIDGVNSGKGVFVAFKYYDAAPNLLQTHLWAIVSLALVSRVWYDKLPPDLQKAVRDVGQGIEPELDRYSVERAVSDTNAWTSHGGKIVKLSPAEQQEAEKRVVAAIQPVLDKTPGLRDFYDQVKSA
ncbi:MAG TPA: TRAP transporter substrate-binding protein, partial [Xanthobacteraceae bacterium]